MTFQALPGFRDFPPADLAVRNHIFGAWRRVAVRYGFEEYDGPPLEPLELYTAKSGDEIVGQLYHFTDKGGREVSLRPEMTPTFARMIAERANGLRKPIRWFAIPQLFRYERQQRGRLREHFQLNCDLVGEAGSLADVEVIALAIDVCRELGLTADDFKVRLSDRRLLLAIFDGLGIPEAARPMAMQMLDKLGRAEYQKAAQGYVEAGGDPESMALLVDDLRLATSWSDLLERAAARPELLSLLGADHPLRSTLLALEAMGLGDFIELDLSIVRGLAYYTGTVFELFDTRRSLRAICGGGRYDNLLDQLGGVDLPAVGFGMGDVVLGELLEDRGLLPAQAPHLDCYLAVITPEDLPAALLLTARLRDAGFSVEYSLRELALGKQLKQADVRGARLGVVVGPEDRQRGEVQLKDFSARMQQAVAIDRLVDHCRELLSRDD